MKNLNVSKPSEVIILLRDVAKWDIYRKSEDVQNFATDVESCIIGAITNQARCEAKANIMAEIKAASGRKD